MLKKNQITSYVSGMQTFFNLFNSAKTFLLTIGVVIIAIINLWLGAKLNPVIENINNLTTRVSANTNNIDANNIYIKEQSQVINKTAIDVAHIRGILDR